MLLTSEGKIWFCQQKDPKPDLWPLLPRDIKIEISNLRNTVPVNQGYCSHFCQADEKMEIMMAASESMKRQSHSSYPTYLIEACFPVILLYARNKNRGTDTSLTPEICCTRQPYDCLLFLSVKEAIANSWMRKRSQGCLRVFSFTLKGD